MGHIHRMTVTAARTPEDSAAGRRDTAEDGSGTFSVFSRGGAPRSGETSADIEGAMEVARVSADPRDMWVPALVFRQRRRAVTSLR